MKKAFSWLSFLLMVQISSICAAQSEDLKFKAFTSGKEHMGLGVSSTIIYGAQDVLLVDAQFKLSNAHRLVAELIETDRNLTHVSITHVYPDHFLGLPVIKSAYPDPKVVSIKESANDVNASGDFKIEYWRNNVLATNGPKTSVFVETLVEPVIMQAGRRLEILGPFQGDAANSGVLWVPLIKLRVASDLIFNHAQALLSAAKTPELAQAWPGDLDKIEPLKASVVVPGHAPSHEYLAPSSIEYTHAYIKTFPAKLKETSNAQRLHAEMSRIYPDIGMRFCLEYTSTILSEHWTWDRSMATGIA